MYVKEKKMELKRLNAAGLPGLKNIPDLPDYDLKNRKCSILHMGVGNFHRSHQAYYLHKLLKTGESDWRICGAGLMPQDIRMKEELASQDYLYTLVTRESGMEDISIIGSIRDFIHIPTELEKYASACRSSDLKILSLTITEKGYCYDNNWNLDKENPGIRHDLGQRDETPVTALGLIVYGLKERLRAGGEALTLLSCDNIPENGDVLKKILFQFLEELGEESLLAYVKTSVSFPCTMVDRITPTTTEESRTYLKEKYGLQDEVPVFGEQFIQWVIEDNFAAERPEWEKVGAQIVKDVKPYELMKIRLLNGGHSALAYISLLAGYQYVDDAMNDKRIREFVRSYMHELKETLNPIQGIDYNAYIETLIKRFANPAVRDRLLRLAEDGSSKILNFITGGLLIRLRKGLPVTHITIALASWICYLNESRTNQSFEVKDPLAEKLQQRAAASLKDAGVFLSMEEVFPPEILQYPDFLASVNRDIKILTDKGAEGLLQNFE